MSSYHRLHRVYSVLSHTFGPIVKWEHSRHVERFHRQVVKPQLRGSAHQGVSLGPCPPADTTKRSGGGVAGQKRGGPLELLVGLCGPRCPGRGVTSRGATRGLCARGALLYWDTCRIVRCKHVTPQHGMYLPMLSLSSEKETQKHSFLKFRMHIHLRKAWLALTGARSEQICSRAVSCVDRVIQPQDTGDGTS